MTKQYDIMVAGHLCLDIIPRFPENTASRIEQILTPGKLVNMEEAKLGTGGTVSNTGLTCKKLGLSVAFAASIADDTLGRLTSDLLAQHGDVSGIAVLSGHSSYSIVIAPPNIDRIFLHHPGTNDSFTAADLNTDTIAKCRHFHFGYPTLMRCFYEDADQLALLFRRAKEAGATTSCDFTLPDPVSPSGKAPWRRILQNALPYIDYFLPSIEETLYMLDTEKFLSLKQKHNNEELISHLTPADYSDIADEILDLGAKIVSLKSGPRGFYLKTGPLEKVRTLGLKDGKNYASRQLWCPAFEVEKIASATGAGDAAIAGFLTAVLKGLSVESALKYAASLGYQNIQALDALSGIRDWSAATGIIKSPPGLIDPNLPESDWTFEPQSGLYAGPDDPLHA